MVLIAFSAFVALASTVALADWLRTGLEEPVVLQTGPDLAETALETGGLVRRLQTGLLRTYVFFLASGAAVAALVFLVVR